MAESMSGAITKVCNKCGEDKPLDAFSPHKEGKFGRYGHCKACQNEIARVRREEKAQREGRIYRPRPKSEEERQYRVWRSKRNAYLKDRFGITLDQYEAMWHTQQGRCPICLRHSDEFKFGLVVDHDHRCCPDKKTCGGCIRALLCQPCNSALGGFQDNSEILLRALDYLRASELEHMPIAMVLDSVNRVVTDAVV